MLAIISMPVLLIILYILVIKKGKPLIWSLLYTLFIFCLSGFSFFKFGFDRDALVATLTISFYHFAFSLSYFLLANLFRDRKVIRVIIFFFGLLFWWSMFITPYM